MGNRQQRRHRGKPHGMSYADQLARQRMLKEAAQQAANDTMVQLKADTHTQRAMWLMCVAMNDAFGIGPDRFKKFAECLQDRSDWYEKHKKETDEDFANEKLRKEAERCSGMKIDYLYEAEIRAAQEKYKDEPVTNWEWLRSSEYRLAEFICQRTSCKDCPGHPYCDPHGDRGNGLVEWFGVTANAEN